MLNNIFPTFGDTVPRSEKEKKLNQKSKVIWFTGLSGSGKSTLAVAVEKKLFETGFLVQVLDGDNIRAGINNNLRFTEEDRTENIRRISEVSKLFVDCGIITINAFISPTADIRDMSKEIIGIDNFIEIYVSTPLEICEKRDVKGLYAKARRGEVKNFTGISSPFDVPKRPDFIINTDEYTLEKATEMVVEFILPQITKK